MSEAAQSAGSGGEAAHDVAHGSADVAADDRALVVIPARLGSTRLPRKPLALVAGRPLIVHVLKRAQEIREATAVLVATDSEEIADAVRAAGGEAVMTSPDCASGTDRVAEAARRRTEGIVVNVQGDEPELPAADVDRLIAAMRAEPSLPIATLAVPVGEGDLRRRSVVKVVRDLRGRALYFSRAGVPHAREGGGGGAPAGVLRHVGVYGFRRDALAAFAALEPTPLERTERLEQLRALEHGWEIGVVLAGRAPPGIDTAEDLEAFRARVAARRR